MMDKKKALASKFKKGAAPKGAAGKVAPKKVTAKKMPAGSAKQAGVAGQQMQNPQPKKRPLKGALSAGLK